MPLCLHSNVLTIDEAFCAIHRVASITGTRVPTEGIVTNLLTVIQYELTFINVWNRKKEEGKERKDIFGG